MSARSVASRKLAISHCLQNLGPLTDKLTDLAACEDSEIGRLQENYIGAKDLDELNKHILQRKAIAMVFRCIEELKEDLHPDELSADAV